MRAVQEASWRGPPAATPVTDALSLAVCRVRSAEPDARCEGTAPVGTNKRYADAVDRRMDSRVVEKVMRSGAPLSLTDDELQLDVYPLTRTPQPEPVTAWVRYPAAPIQVEGVAVAWTPRAVAIRWKGPDGAEHRAWVWASAVER